MNKIIKTADEHAAAITQLSAQMDADPAPAARRRTNSNCSLT